MKKEIPYSESLYKLLKETAKYAASVGAIAQNTGHLCIAMCTDKSGEAYQVLIEMKINPKDIMEGIQALQRAQKAVAKQSDQIIPQSGAVQKAIKAARSTAITWNIASISTDLVLFGILNARNCIACEVLNKFGITEYKLLTHIQNSQVPVMAN